MGCLEGYGLCGLTPERPLLLFVRSSPPDVSPGGLAAAFSASSAARQTATTLYAINRNEVMTYAAAVQYCRCVGACGPRACGRVGVHAWGACEGCLQY